MCVCSQNPVGTADHIPILGQLEHSEVDLHPYGAYHLMATLSRMFGRKKLFV